MTTVFFAIFGAGLHFLRAAIGANERPIVESGLLYRMTDHWFAKHVLKAEFTDNGAWEMLSGRNLLISMATTAIWPLFFGIFWWQRQPEALAAGCKVYGWLGLQPVFCW